MNKQNNYLIFFILLTSFFFFDSCSKEDNIDLKPVAFGTVTDIEGNIYNTITIEITDGTLKSANTIQKVTQTWMVENLKTTKYGNGEIIETTSPATLNFFQDSDTLFNYQWAYGGDESNVDIYGRLYTWGAVMDSRNICPDGWHVPTKAEWSQLAIYLGGKFVEDGDGMGSWSGVGGKLKETGYVHWKSTNTGAVNSIGMTFLPGGTRSSFDGSDFWGITERGVWWSSTEDLNRSYRWAWTYTTGYLTAGLWTAAYFVNDGISVRCMR